MSRALSPPGRQARVPTGPLAWSCVDILDDPSDERVSYHMFIVRDWSGGEPRRLGSEHSELAWFDLASAERLDGLALEDYRLLFHDLSV